MASSRNTVRVTGDDARVRDMLLWARRERIVVNRIVVGDVQLDCNDLALVAQYQPPRSDEEAAANLYARYGGDALDEAAKESEEMTTLEEDE